MPSRAKPAIIGPIASDRSLQFNLMQECYKTLLDPQGQSSNPDASIDFDCPCHRDTIPKKGIVSTSAVPLLPLAHSRGVLASHISYHVSKMALIYKVLFPSLSTFETPTAGPPAPAHHSMYSVPQRGYARAAWQ